MNALRSFFKKYDAVIADDKGINFETATDEALINWCKSNCKAWDENIDARPELLPVMKDQRKETHKRASKYESMSAEKKPLLAAWFEICARIGFGE